MLCSHTCFAIITCFALIDVLLSYMFCSHTCTTLIYALLSILNLVTWSYHAWLCRSVPAKRSPTIFPVILDVSTSQAPCEGESCLDRLLLYPLLHCFEPIPRSVPSNVLPDFCSSRALQEIKDAVRGMFHHPYSIVSSIPSNHEQPFDDLAACLFE